MFEIISKSFPVFQWFLCLQNLSSFIYFTTVQRASISKNPHHCLGQEKCFPLKPQKYLLRFKRKNFPNDLIRLLKYGNVQFQGFHWTQAEQKSFSCSHLKPSKKSKLREKTLKHFTNNFSIQQKVISFFIKAKRETEGNKSGLAVKNLIRFATLCSHCFNTISDFFVSLQKGKKSRETNDKGENIFTPLHSPSILKLHIVVPVVREIEIDSYKQLLSASDIFSSQPWRVKDKRSEIRVADVINLKKQQKVEGGKHFVKLNWLIRWNKRQICN